MNIQCHPSWIHFVHQNPQNPVLYFKLFGGLKKGKEKEKKYIAALLAFPVQWPTHTCRPTSSRLEETAVISASSFSFSFPWPNQLNIHKIPSDDVVYEFPININKAVYFINLRDPLSRERLEEEGEKGGQKISEEWTIYRKGAHSNGFPDAKHISAAPSKRRKGNLFV